MTIDLTHVSYVMAAVVAYYAALFVLALRKAAPAPDPEQVAAAGDLTFVVLVPARNEELVIGRTVRDLLALDHPRLHVLVIDDDSTDATVAEVEKVRHPRLHLLLRPRGGQGKGAVLNAGLREVRSLRARQRHGLGSVDADHLIVLVVDADGALDADCLDVVTPAFADPAIGAVQVGVRIANAADGLLPRLQDLEFIGFSGVVQQARRHLGSVGLGGNGQLARLSALDAVTDGPLGGPWTDCLTEDLDLGLRLVKAGWKTTFRGETFVAQQGLTSLRPLLRQRTRWVQGHYQCWRHLPGLLRAKGVPWRTRLDLSAYLALVTFVVLAFTNSLLTLAADLGLVTVHNRFLSFLPPGPAQNAASVLIGFGPLLTFVAVYQRRARNRLAVWELPAYAFAFWLYGYVWVAATAGALYRMATRRRGWTKTPRALPSSDELRPETGLR